MSMTSTHKVTCPNCKHEQDFVIWNTLNTTIDPEAQQGLIDGSLFRFKCDECDQETNVYYDILYHDMKNHTMVYCVIPEMVEQAREYMILAQKQLEKPGAPMPKTRNRIVTNVNRLREKAIIFNEKLDDRIVEIVKLLCWMEAAKTIKDVKEDDMYFNVLPDGGWIVEIVGQDMSCNVPKELYAQTATQFMPIFNALGDEEFIIDYNFAGTICMAFNDAHKNDKKKRPW